MSIAHHSKLLLLLLPHCTHHSQYYGEQPLCIHSMHFVDIFSCRWCVHFIHGAALLTVVQPCCYEWTGVGSCQLTALYTTYQVYNLKKGSRKIIFPPHFQWGQQPTKGQFKCILEELVGSTDICSEKIQRCLYGSCAWTKKCV